MPLLSSPWLSGRESQSASQWTDRVPPAPLRLQYLCVPSRSPLSTSSSSSSCHVHAKPATAPTLPGSRFAQAHLQEPVRQAAGRRVVCCRGSGRGEAPEQICRRRKTFWLSRFWLRKAFALLCKFHQLVFFKYLCSNTLFKPVFCTSCMLYCKTNSLKHNYYL